VCMCVLTGVKVEPTRREFKIDEDSEPSRFYRMSLLHTKSFAYQRNPRE
jgi:hypothetical protein